MARKKKTDNGAAAVQMPVSLGRIVWVCPAGAERHYAAIVTAVHEPGNPESAIDAQVFRPNSVQDMHGLKFGPDAENHCWVWPDRLPDATVPVDGDGGA